VVIVLGLALAIPTVTQREGLAPRPATVGNMEAMQQARTPPWVAFLNPLVGALGVLLGGRRSSIRRS